MWNIVKVGITKLMGGKINLIIKIFVLLIIFSCKKKEQKNLLQLTQLSDYVITKTKINDSITIVKGNNESYNLEGTINESNNSKEGWWKVQNKLNSEFYNIEYIFLDKQIENEIKIYKSGQLQEDLSKFYTASPDKNGVNFKFYFPESKFKTYNVSFNYTVSDSIKRRIIKNEKLNCTKIVNYYSCYIPVKHNESIIGIVTRFSSFKQKDSVLLAADRMFIKPVYRKD